jgi:hypothetical protein
MLSGRDVVVVTNARGYIVNYVHPANTTILMMETGGFLPEFASAFGLVDSALVRQRLIQYRENQDLSASANLFIPQSIAHLCHWQESDEIIGFLVHIISDSPWKLKEHGIINKRPLTPSWFRRLMLAFPLMLGQVAIFTIPLLIFGLKAFLWGEATLISAGLFVAIFWNVINGRGWVKGLLIGICAGLLFGLMGHVLFIPSDLYLKLFICFLMSAIWMGFVYEGIKR